MHSAGPYASFFRIVTSSWPIHPSRCWGLGHRAFSICSLGWDALSWHLHAFSPPASAYWPSLIGRKRARNLLAGEIPNQWGRSSGPNDSDARISYSQNQRASDSCTHTDFFSNFSPFPLMLLNRTNLPLLPVGSSWTPHVSSASQGCLVYSLYSNMGCPFICGRLDTWTAQSSPTSAS